VAVDLSATEIEEKLGEAFADMAREITSALEGKP